MNAYNLKELQEKVELYRALERRKNSLAKQKDTLFAEECRLAAVRTKEDADVEKWEGGSLAAFFYGVVGKREGRIEKEKQEAYEAAVKHDAVKAELAAVEADLQKVNGELQRLKGCEWEYKKAIDEKAAALAAAGKDNGILQLEQEQGKVKEQWREVKEALTAGNEALRKVREAKSLLSEAKGWGAWDMMGGGMLSTMMKHDRLKEAQWKIEQMQVSLRRFRTELADVDIAADLSIEIDDFTRIADYIFDCIFVDWEVQNKIVDALTKVANVEGQLTAACDRLRQMDKNLDEKWLRLQEEWQKKVVEL